MGLLPEGWAVTERLLFAWTLSALAGLSTTIGSVLGIAVRKPGSRFMTFTLGFSAGVMILVSFVELLQGGVDSVGFLRANIAFFSGMGAMFLIDVLVPHDYLGQQERSPAGMESSSLLRAGLFVALGIGIHNFPDGMASFAGALKDPSLGVAIAVAIAIHNIPEGLAVAAPVYAATGSRRRAFLWLFASGLGEPVGAGRSQRQRSRHSLPKRFSAMSLPRWRGSRYSLRSMSSRPSLGRSATST
jgi:ZIP family zinc transporter